ncbi:MAG: hypothetical protein ACLPJH_08055 [Myxococcaceae bacterium]
MTSFVIPNSAPPGTVIPYFCVIHLSMMGQSQITVSALDGGPEAKE